MFDFVIRDARIVDGTGAEPYRGDVGVRDGRVTAVKPVGEGRPGLPSDAAKTIEAGGRMLVPGFVDVHSHSDMNVLVNPNAESKLRQGITTEIVGNCGFSAFPLRGAMLAEEQESNAKVGLDITWATVDEYFDRLDEARPAVNIASFTGHGNIRGSVLGFDDRPPRPDEMRQMVREVEEAMDAGAIGLTTGLIYAPGIFAPTEEIVGMQKAAARFGGIYASHVRSEGDALLEAADEFMGVIDGAGCQGQFSHLKASGPRNWGKVQRVVEQIEAVNARGGRVCFDKYPYIASSTGLASLLPRWAQDGGRERAVERLLDPKLRDRILRESAEINEGRDGWDSVLICDAGAAEYDRFQGKSIGDIARELGGDAGEVFLDLLVKSRLLTSICNFTMSQEETDLVLLHPLGMVCTDAACRAPYGALSHDCPHPRAYGTFAKFFRDYVKERPLLTVQEAVRKVTSLPCDVFGLRDRGRVAEGYFADLLLLDWDRFEDRARFADPHHYCAGIDLIAVNGVITVKDGEHTGNRGGRALRRGN